ncbi:MAG: LacI family DNA-binding transcriptional regulator [Armatimonadota bacterium]
MSRSAEHDVTRAITMEMIARRCGVHRSTVQRALNSGPVRHTTAERIRTIAAEMGYDPAAHRAAAQLVSLRHGRRVINRVVALYLPAIFSKAFYFLRLLQGMMDALTEMDFDLLVTHYAVDASPPRQLPSSILSGNVDAVVTAMDPRHFGPLLQQLRATPYFGDRPIITLFDPAPGTYSALIDDYTGAYLATEHLLALGHRQVMYIHGMADHFHMRQRITGVIEAIQRHGLDPANTLYHRQIPWSTEPVEQRFAAVLRQALAECPEATGLLLPNDHFALTARNVLLEVGKTIPQQMSIVGFDDVEPLHDGDGNDMLTTVHAPLEELGRATARMTVQHICGDEEANARIILPVSLTVRHSTCPYP